MLAIRDWIFAWPPHVGLSIVILGICGVIMAVRADVWDKREKAIWIGIAFMLGFGEIYAMQHQEMVDTETSNAEKQERERKASQDRIEEDNRFAKILAENQTQFDATILRLDGVFRLTNKSLQSVIGGDSYCYMIFQANSVHLVILAEGDYPLYNVSARVVDLRLFQANTNGPSDSYQSMIEIGEMAPSAARVYDGQLPFPHDHQDFNIFFVARNGYWTEQLRYRGPMSSRASAVRVFRTTPSGQLIQHVMAKVDDGYPRNSDGSIPWNDVSK